MCISDGTIPIPELALESESTKGVPIWHFCRYADIGDCRYADIADIFILKSSNIGNIGI